MPTPYETLVATTAALAEAEVLSRWEEVDIEADEVATFFATHQGTLDTARQLLSRKCAVPQMADIETFNQHCDDFGRLRQLSHAFALEWRLAFSDADLVKAGRIGLDMLELANAVRRGGLLIDALVSMGMSTTAVMLLSALREDVLLGISANATPDGSDRNIRRELIGELQRIDREREPLAEITTRDCEYVIAANYPDEPIDFSSLENADPDECDMSPEDKERIIDAMSAIANTPGDEKQTFYREADHRNLALLRLLMTELAIREFQLAHSKLPDRLDLLAPEFFTSVPLDPFTDESFVYRVAPEGSFTLHSPGPTEGNWRNRLRHFFRIPTNSVITLDEIDGPADGECEHV